MSRNKIFIIILAVIVIIINHFISFAGHFGYDDMEYAKIANNWLSGNFDWGNHYSFRWTLISMLSASYYLFGINDFSSALPSILVTSASIVFVAAFLRKATLPVFIIAIFLFVFNNWTLYYSDKIMPDIFVAFGILISAYYYYLQRFYPKKSSILPSLFFVLGLLFAFVSKETVALAIPSLLILFIIDIVKKQNLNFWKYSTIFGIISLIIYFVSIKILTGHFLSRFDAISANSYVNPCSYDLLPIEYLLKRISYELILSFINQYMFVILIVIILAFSFPIRKLLDFSVPESFSLFFASTLILSAQFMSISYSSYVPMCVDARHYLFIIPIAAVGIAPHIANFFQYNWNGKSLLIGLLVFTTIAFLTNIETAYWLYIPILTLVYVRYISNAIQLKYQYLFIGLFAIILLLKQFEIFNKNKEVNFEYQMQKTDSIIKSLPENSVIVTNTVQKRFAEYYLQFDTSKYKFVDFKSQMPVYINNYKDVYLLNNWISMYLSGLNYDSLPIYFKELKKNYNSIIDTGKNNFCVKVPNFVGIFNKLAIKSLNTFDKTDGNWNQSSDNVIESNSDRGKIYKVGEYSSTFKFRIDSTPSFFALNLSLKLKCKNIKKAQFVISCENGGNNAAFWESAALSEVSKSEDEWKLFKWNRFISPSEFLPGAQIVIYVWNPEKEEIFIDDFEVSIFQTLHK